MRKHAKIKVYRLIVGIEMNPKNGHMTLETENINKVKSDRELSKPALMTFFRIAEFWKLSDHEQIKLLGTTNFEFNQWKLDLDNSLISEDTMLRISYMIGIYKALHNLLPHRNDANEWIRKINKVPRYEGQSALEIMMKGDLKSLRVLRQYLDEQCYG